MVKNSIDQVAPAAWQSLARRHIFFGHRSVGRNLVEGLERLLASQDSPALVIHRRKAPGASGSPGLYELDIGSNRIPATKDLAFANILASGFGDIPGAIAMQKYCYVDVGPKTDPVRLFDQYAAHVARCRKRHPGLTWVHFTIPLQTVPGGVYETIGNWVGAPTHASLNASRERFNDLMRSRYGATEPVFDIAAMQSTRADGGQVLRRYRGSLVRTMAPEWTDDGGHLNEAGREWVAAPFLTFLASLP